jgi:hypothetical protein
MHDRKLPAKPVGRHSDPHPHWRLPLRLALPLTGCSGHIATLFVICFEISTSPLSTKDSDIAGGESLFVRF